MRLVEKFLCVRARVCSRCPKCSVALRSDECEGRSQHIILRSVNVGGVIQDETAPHAIETFHRRLKAIGEKNVVSISSDEAEPDHANKNK